VIITEQHVSPTASKLFPRFLVLSGARLGTRAARNAHAGAGSVCAGRAYSMKLRQRNTKKHGKHICIGWPEL